jgi:hypothetical protein
MDGGEGRAGENDSGIRRRGFEPRGKGNWICRGKRLRCAATWVSNGITEAHESRSKIEIPIPIPIPGLSEGSWCWYFYSCCCCEQPRRRILAEVPPYSMWRISQRRGCKHPRSSHPMFLALLPRGSSPLTRHLVLKRLA